MGCYDYHKNLSPVVKTLEKITSHLALVLPEAGGTRSAHVKVCTPFWMCCDVCLLLLHDWRAPSLTDSPMPAAFSVVLVHAVRSLLCSRVRVRCEHASLFSQIMPPPLPTHRASSSSLTTSLLLSHTPPPPH